LKITFLTRDRAAACSDFYINALKSNENVTFFDEDFDSYDIALVMTYDHSTVPIIKKKHPHLKIGIIDPRNHGVYESTKHCDFLIVDSIEMEDFWRQSKKPIFRYIEYPNIPLVSREHKNKEKITIAYHGNQIHLGCMYESVTPALTELGKRHDLELLVMYNGPAPSGTEDWCPKGVSIRHVRWSPNAYIDELAKCDIGIVPNNIIMSEEQTRTNKKFNYSKDDYSIRFKMPSNPGRFVVFGRLGIPVVADFYPSALQYIKDDTGFVACNPSGWEYCLEQLIESSELRNKMGKSLQNLVLEEFDFETQNKKLNSFLGNIL